MPPLLVTARHALRLDLRVTDRRSAVTARDALRLDARGRALRVCLPALRSLCAGAATKPLRRAVEGSIAGARPPALRSRTGAPPATAPPFT